MIGKNQKTSINSLAFVLGFTSVIGQVVLLRELVSIFYGNETSYAVILASWLFWIAVGSFTASKLVKWTARPERFLAVCQVGLALILPASVVAVRSIKLILNVSTGEMLSIVSMTGISFVLLAPLTLLLGAMFPLICARVDAANEQDKTASVQRIYLYESLGAAVGGVLFTFVLVHFLPALHITVCLGIVNCLFAVLVQGRRSLYGFGGGAILVLVCFGVMFGGITQLDNWTRKVQWHDFDLVATTDSIYGNIALIKKGGHYSFYENGLHSATTGDDLTNEESVHYALLQHPQPRKVLLIGNGITGSIKEVLKHPRVVLDYAELDPELINVAQKHLPRQILKPLENKRVDIYHKDGRLFVKQTDNSYDVVIVNLSDPVTALLNRYYSLEFFEEVRQILNSGGILSLSVSSSENYLNEEARSFLRSIHSTLRQVFADVQSIPGETNIFLSSDNQGLLTIDADLFVQRLKERRITTKHVREYYLPFRLSADRIGYINEVLDQKGQINTDERPIGYLYDIILFSTHFNTGFKKFVEKVMGVKPYHLAPLLLLLVLGGWIAGKKNNSFPINLSIVTTGFSEIIFQVIVILAFQTLYGYAYYKIGLIIASFMAGLVLGSLWAKRFLGRSLAEILKAYKWTQGAIVLYPLLLPFLFVVFRDILSVEKNTEIFATVFAVLPGIAGTIGGLQYPLANHIVYTLKKDQRVARPAGFLYAGDVFGASIGALLTGAVLIPLWGIHAVAYFCAALNAAVLLVLLSIKSR